MSKFSRQIKKALAERAGHVCSFPGCNVSTVGPSEESEYATSNTGMACHIVASSSDEVSSARRVDISMKETDKNSISNGIWMCYTHGKLIDTDENTYTTHKLREWKVIAEEKARKKQKSCCTREFLVDPVLPNETKVVFDNDLKGISLIGDAIHDSNMAKAWGETLTRSVREFCIEHSSNAFKHGKADSFSIEILHDSIVLSDNGLDFNVWELIENVKGRRGGNLAFGALIEYFDSSLAIFSKRQLGKNIVVLTKIKVVSQLLELTACRAELNFDQLTDTHFTMQFEESCKEVYITLPRYCVVSHVNVFWQKTSKNSPFGNAKIIFVLHSDSELVRKQLTYFFPKCSFLYVSPDL